MRFASFILIMLTTIAFGPVVVAQSSPDTRSAQKPGEPPPYDLTQPPPNLADLMRRNNGSLYRAAMSMPNDPRIIRAPEASFFNVPAAKPKLLVKHDLITIIVRETSENSSEGGTETKKSADFDAKLSQFPKLALSNFAVGNAIGSVTPELKMNGDRNFKGEATVDRKDTLTARIQAEVVDVKPNGTVVLQARKRIVTDEEDQLFLLTGTARAQDVLPDNTVQSTQLFDLEIRKTHSGAVRTATKRGWVPKFFDWLNPF